MKRKRTQKNRRLSMEKLDSRTLLAADIMLVDGFVAINGSESNDTVEAYMEDGQAVVQVSQFDACGQLVDQMTKSFSQDDVQGFFFNGNGGDDVFVNDTDVPSVVRGGTGDDNILGGLGNDVLSGVTAMTCSPAVEVVMCCSAVPAVISRLTRRWRKPKGRQPKRSTRRPSMKPTRLIRALQLTKSL
jgi:hypothetical protein